jgi:outer membrane protein TolC
MKTNKILILVFFISIPLVAAGQSIMSLTDAIKIATDSSLAAFKAQNLYLASYWEYRSYLASKKPSLTFNTTFLDYSRALNKVYNSVKNIYQYSEQQDIYSSANAMISQRISTGGTVYFDSQLSRLQNFGIDGFTQYSSVPLRIGISQSLFGYNEFKWERKIEPLKYEEAKKEYLQSVESVSLRLVSLYFDLIIAKAEVTMAETNVANADTLYNIGQKRNEIASLSLADALTLKVEALNARNNLAESKKELRSAQYLFNSYLRLDVSEMADLLIPESLPSFTADYEVALQLALLNNPEILSNKLTILESESALDQAKRDNLFSAYITASYGLNQHNPELANAYRDPMNQQVASIGLTIPIIDWGRGKGEVNVAKKNYEVTKISVEQAVSDFRQEVMMAVINFNTQAEIVKSAFETREVAKQAFEINKQRFLIGKVDVNSLTLALSRQDQATLAYLNALRYYWSYYYTLRELTLYDFEANKPLEQDFDEALGLK